MTTVDNSFLEENLLNDLWLWVSTVKPDHYPALHPFWFLWAEEKIYLFQPENATILNNVQHTPFVTCALETVNFGQNCFILEGKVEILQTHERRDLFALYLDKYDFEAVAGVMGWDVNNDLIHKFPIALCITPTKRLPWPPANT
jgi:hypothetical protein